MRRNINKKIARNVIADSIIVVVVLFAMALMSIFGFHIFSETVDGIDTSEMSTEAQEVLTDMETGYPNWMNGGFLFALVLLWIMVIAASLVVRSHPLFFLVTLLILIFIVVLGAILSNTYAEVIADPDLGDTADSFTPTTFVMNNFVAFVIFIGASIALALFGSQYFG